MDKYFHQKIICVIISKKIFRSAVSRTGTGPARGSWRRGRRWRTTCRCRARASRRTTSSCARAAGELGLAEAGHVTPCSPLIGAAARWTSRSPRWRTRGRTSSCRARASPSTPRSPPGRCASESESVPQFQYLDKKNYLMADRSHFK